MRPAMGIASRSRLATPCCEPGCPALAWKRGRCPIHQPKGWAVARPYPSGWAWERIRARVLLRDNYRCIYCGSPAEVIDHIVGRARGGADTDDNLAAACKRCNEAKRRHEARR